MQSGLSPKKTSCSAIDPPRAPGRAPSKCFSERAVRLFVNEELAKVFMCTPQQLDDLAVGHLLTTGRIAAADEVLSCRVDAARQEIQVQLSKKTAQVDADARALIFSDDGLLDTATFPVHDASVDRVLYSLRQLELAAAAMVRSAVLYQNTGGVHCAAFGDGQRLVCREDIGRSNAVDKAAGAALRAGLNPAGGFLLVTGRLALEMLLKAGGAGVPIVASLNIPSDLTLEAAERMRITVVGKMLKKEQHVYTFPKRIG